MKNNNKVLLSTLVLYMLGTLTVNAQTITIQASKTIGKEFSPQNIVDGDLSTKWISDEKSNAWVIVDLGKEIEIWNLSVYFDTRWPEKYKVLYSSDQSTWTPVPLTTKQKPIKMNKLVQSIILSKKVGARYLKVECEKPATTRGFGICEVKVNGAMLGDFSLAEAKDKFRNEPMWNTLFPAKQPATVVSSKPKTGNVSIETFSARPPWAGFYLNTNSDVSPYPFVTGVADRLKWSKMEPKSGQYDFTDLDNALTRADKVGQYYYFVLWTGSHCPDWLFDIGVPKVLVLKSKKNKDDEEKYYPYYEDQIYKTHLFTFLNKLAEHIASLPPGLRSRIAFIQPGFGNTGDRQLYSGKTENPAYEIDEKKYFDIMKEFTTKLVDAFRSHPETERMRFLWNLEEEDDGKHAAYASWVEENYNTQLRKTGWQGYSVNGELPNYNVIRIRNFGLDGKSPYFCRTEASQDAQNHMSKLNKYWNYYWCALSGIQQGRDMWEVQGKSIQDVESGRYNEAFELHSRYAFYKQPQTSPYAFVALRDVLDYSDTERFTESLYGPANKKNADRIKKIVAEFASHGAKVDDINAVLNERSLNYNKKSKGLNDVNWEVIPGNYNRFIEQINPEKTSVGYWRVGPVDQPYGRYARSFEHKTGKDAMYFRFDKNFFNDDHKPTGPLTFRVVWLDNTAGSWSFSYDAGPGNFKSAKTFTGTGSNRWREETIIINDAFMHNNGPQGADIGLVNLDEKDKAFHMIEVQRGEAKAQ